MEQLISSTEELHQFFGLHSKYFVMFIITWSAKIKAIQDKFRELSYTILLLSQLLARDSQTLLPEGKLKNTPKREKYPKHRV